MSVINLLSPHVADLIAAGEVVERPASVVKELMENSMDAGARSLTVEIARGGMGMIRVMDDGSGMSPEDAGLCFLRHATSKLRDESGLAAISTMGFRGEALAAISAVSHIELRLLAAGARRGFGAAGVPQRERRHKRVGLRLRAALLPRQPQRTVFLHQRPPIQVCAITGGAGAGL